MARYELDSISFEPPADWTTKRVDVITGDPPPSVKTGWRPSISVTREPRQPGDTLHAHAFRTLLQRSTIVPGRSLNPSTFQTKVVTVGGRPAARTTVTWDERGGKRNQTLVHVEAPEGDVVILAGPTFPPGCAPEAEWMETFDRVLASARFDAHPSSEKTEKPVSSEIPPTPVAPVGGFAGYPYPGTRRRPSDPGVSNG